MDILKTIIENNVESDRIKIILSKVNNSQYNIFFPLNHFYFLGKRNITFNPNKYC